MLGMYAMSFLNLKASKTMQLGLTQTQVGATGLASMAALGQAGKANGPAQTE